MPGAARLRGHAARAPGGRRADETIRDIRAAIFSLQSRGETPAPGLRGRVLWLVDEMTESPGFAPTLRMAGPLDTQVPDHIATQMLAALREALANVAKHAQASRVNVAVEAGTELVLVIRDNGVGIIRLALLSVRIQLLTDPERRVHVELPVHALLPWAEVGGRLGHGDHLGSVDLIRVPIGHNGRRAAVENVLEPIGAFTIRKGDQEAVIMLDCDDRRLVHPARAPPDMADHRRTGSGRARRPQSERPHGPGEQTQSVLDRTSHAPTFSAVGGRQ